MKKKIEIRKRCKEIDKFVLELFPNAFTNQDYIIVWLSPSHGFPFKKNVKTYSALEEKEQSLNALKKTMLYINKVQKEWRR